MMTRMITPQDIEKLASLARIQVTDDEKSQFGKEIDSILSYVAQINQASVSLSQTPETGPVKNEMRSDAHAHESALHTDTILEAAPSKEKGYIKVKKILS